MFGGKPTGSLDHPLDVAEPVFTDLFPDPGFQFPKPALVQP